MPKRIFITGASTGFGHDAAKALAARGHTVYATMRGVAGKNAEPAKGLTEWAAAEGKALHVLECDVSDQAAVDAAVGRAISDGGLDVVMNNAGVGNWGIDEGFAVEQAQQLFNVNLFGVMRVNRAALPHFRDKGAGLLMYISSGLGRILFPFLAVYNASKHALEGYAETVAYETRPLGISSLIVQPGAFGTPFLMNAMQPANDKTGTYGPVDDMFKAFGGGFEEQAKSGQLGDPQVLVDALVEETERDAGPERPLRRVVGDDVAEPVGAINAVAEQMQTALFEAFGLQ